MICDFCSKPDPEWTHFTQEFSVETRVQSWNDDGNWAVCNTCHVIVLSGDKKALLRRSINSDPHPEIDGSSRRIRTLHKLFWDNYERDYERIPEEELTAEHRLLDFHQNFGEPFRAFCNCGWKGTPSWSYEAARDEFAEHTGGKDWSVTRPEKFS